MLRRLALGALALTALGLVTGMSDSGTAGMGTSMPGMGMGPIGMPGMSMGIWPLGIPGMDPRGMSWMGQMGMGGTGTGMSGMGMSGMSQRSAPGAGIGYTYRPTSNHPGDLSGIVACTGCGTLFDVCVFGGQCTYMEAGLWPETLGLHPTTNRPSLPAYWPEGPMSCARGRGNNPAACVDAPGEWNLRAGMPGAAGATGGSSR
jgi:hypothetical protein